MKLIKISNRTVEVLSLKVDLRGKDKNRMLIANGLLTEIVNAVKTSGKEVEDLANKLSKIPVKKLEDEFGKFVGKGTTRAVFRRKDVVVKRAINKKGLIQNKRQSDVYKTGKKKLLSPVYTLSDNKKILVMKDVPPLKKQKWSPKEMKEIGMILRNQEVENILEEEVSVPYVLTGPKWKWLDKWEWGDGWSNVVTEDGEAGFIGDLVKPDSWGRDEKGNLVLVDYGY